MLAPAEAELDLDFVAAVKIQGQRNQRTAFERDLADQPLDFMLMQEQTPRPARFVIELVAEFKGFDVYIAEHDGIAFHDGIAAR